MRSRRLRVVLALAILALLIAGGVTVHRYLAVGTAYLARMTCSGVFVSGQPAERMIADLAIDDLSFLRHFRVTTDDRARTATASARVVSRTAAYRDEFGCALDVAADSSPERRLRLSRPGLETGTFDPAVMQVVDAGFEEPDPALPRRTRAVVVVRGGRVVAERYSPGVSAETPLIGWSVSKSVLHALIGIAIAQGRLELDAPAPIPEWRDDERAAITIEQLLRMSSGLRFRELYEPFRSDALPMLFGAPDAAGYAASKELEAEPGTVWHYSSGTSNILAAALRNALGDDARYHAFPRVELFDRIGMSTALIETDAEGTFVASSYMFASARDWARFGLLYLRDGVWEGERILPEGWVAHARSPASADTTGRFGAHWWLGIADEYCPSKTPLPADAFHAIGHEAQFVTIVPSAEVVIVRLGRARLPGAWDQCRFVRDILDAL